QQATTIWYHDHALGITRLNVYMGMAGFYVIDDPANPPAGIPHLDDYDIGLAIQDRMFDSDGNFFYPVADVSNGENPLWSPEFFGDTILVNGAVWPVLNVEPRTYRFRLLNGSNARVYALELINQGRGPSPELYQIGTDGGYLAEPALISKALTIAPGERMDLIIDFSAFARQEILLANSGRTPFPKGSPVNPLTTGKVMLFRVGAATESPFVFDPGAVSLPAAIPDIAAEATKTIQMTLNESMAPNGVPLMALLNGRMWDHPVEEVGKLGETQIWEIINLTGDTHPIHLHLTQFQLLNRQSYNVNKYMTAYMAANDGMMAPFMDDHIIPDITPYLQGRPEAAPANEAGWKDTVQMNPGEVTRIAVRFARQNGQGYGFDATDGPGYVWHCHILEHEDNEMMRPLMIIS
ncbi:MAG TPA: multicopper oxidase domain-containing protein, partial [Anaerolineaceae bacterium]|nr:multicopper oxidase domain-containing protein [Anaerolineaceae bacterium]